MPLDQIITLAIIQGLTEFLPISSSGHLVLIPVLFGWKDQGLFMDVALHIGTLGAVLLYFHKDTKSLFVGFFHLLRWKKTREKRLFIHLVVATLPVVGVGYVMDRWGGNSLRTVGAIAWSSIIFGGMLYLADRWGRGHHTLAHMNTRTAFLFGVAQVFSLINGASRSGVCLMAGRLLDYARKEAAHFAFLMAIPAITAAASLKGYQCVQKNEGIFFPQALLGASVSFATGLVTISFMMRWLRKHGFTPFILYRIALGLLLLVLYK